MIQYNDMQTVWTSLGYMEVVQCHRKVILDHKIQLSTYKCNYVTQMCMYDKHFLSSSYRHKAVP